MNPTASIKPDIERFHRDYANQIQSYQSVSKKIRYAWSGDPRKRPLVFVHGSPGSWEVWSHFLLDENLQKNFHLIAVDRPGYGGSDPGHAEISLASQADDIIDVLKFNQSALPAILVGHSYGGPVIAEMAMRHPQKIAGLVFVASAVDPQFEKIAWYQRVATWWPFRLLIPTDLRVCNEEIIPLKEELEKMGPFWKEISAKTVLIQGEKDPLVNPGNLDFLLQHLDQKIVTKVFRIPDLNHFVPWKRPDLILDGVQEIKNALEKQKENPS